MHIHKWSKWEDIGPPEMTYESPEHQGTTFNSGWVVFQKRQCSRCGEAQLRSAYSDEGH
jgi:hypothetical protein